MAEVTISTNHSSVPKLVMGVIATMAAKKEYFNKFKGESEDSIIQVLTGLKKEPGDSVTAHLAIKIVGDGKVDDETLEDNETDMEFQKMTVLIGQRRNAIRLKGRMTEKRSRLKLRKEAASRLSTWLAEVKDEETFYQLSCMRGIRAGTLSLSVTFPNAYVTPDTDHLVAANGKTFATLTASDKFTTAEIDTVVEKIRLSDDLRSVTVDGMEVLAVAVISPEQATSLRKDTYWRDAQLHANVEGLKNPIFTGMMGIYNGVVVHVHRNIVKFNNAGASGNVTGCRALFLCAQAGVQVPVTPDEPEYVEQKFDYGNKTGFAVGFIHGIKGSAYTTQDGTTTKLFGRILCDTAA